ncbi:hypothetical protein Mapa_005760 [Marchantia paleacea]|nr:hypothetical protein Mapa_005760 [Marchantia paleacea]
MVAAPISCAKTALSTAAATASPLLELIDVDLLYASAESWAMTSAENLDNLALNLLVASFAFATCI